MIPRFINTFWYEGSAETRKNCKLNKQIDLKDNSPDWKSDLWKINTECLEINIESVFFLLENDPPLFQMSDVMKNRPYVIHMLWNVL